MDDETENRPLNRRTFLTTAAITGIAAVAADELRGAQPSSPEGRKAANVARGDKQFVACCPSLGLCTATCPLKVTVRDGRITHITNLPGYTCCVKGRSQRRTIYDESRLKYPMKREGRRGEGRFQRISWDEALDIYAAKIQEVRDRHGNEGILFYPGRGTGGLARMAPRVRFPNVLGGMVNTWGSLCVGNKTAAAAVMYGTSSTESDLDTIRDSRLAIIWGYGFADSNRRGDFAGEGMRILMDARERGTRIVVIDPFFSQTAAKADQWIAILPGTDGAMALAMANVIVERRLCDEDFVARRVLGFDEFRQHVRKYTPEFAARITGVPAETITNLAVEYATEHPSAIFPGDGPSRAGCDPSQWVLACGALAALTGSVGKPGTNATSGMGFNKQIHIGDLGATRSRKVRVQVNECRIADAILSGKAPQPDGSVTAVSIRMLIGHGASVVNQAGDSNKIARALDSLDYIICADQFPTPFSRYADLLLPATTVFEGHDCGFYGQAGHAIVYSEKCIEPMYECRSDIAIWGAVAKRLGAGEAFHSDWEDEDWMRATLKASASASGQADLTLERLQKEKIVFVGPRPFIPFQAQIRGGQPFPTKSGKIELYSKAIEDKGLPPLPTYLDEFENRRHPLAEKYPLAICTPHSVARLHSRFNGPWIASLHPREVFINPADAARRTIGDGDTVLIFNDRGATERKARVSGRVPPGVIAMHQGWWYEPGQDGIDHGGAVNTVTADTLDRIGGSGTYNSVLVDVKRAQL
jgi:anaerobic dimethyl sulfoxide reductase subunit A